MEKQLVTTKTWNYLVNQFIESAPTRYDAQDAPRGRKEVFLVGKSAMLLGAVPWVSVNSHSEVKGLGADNLQDHLDLRWSTGPGVQHSWWQARNTAMGCEAVFDHIANVQGGGKMDVWFAPSSDPFTGGSATARPTSTSEFQMLLYTASDGFGYWGLDNVSGSTAGDTHDFMVHAWHSDDGESTRLIIQRDNRVTGFWRMDRLEDFAQGWNFPFNVRIRQANASNSITETGRSVFWLDQPHDVSVNNAGTLFHAHMSPTSFRDVNNTVVAHQGHAAHSHSGRVAFDRIEIVNEVDVANQRWGRVPDLWLSPVGAHVPGVSVGAPGGGYSGQLLQGDNGQRYARFGDFLFPWPADTHIRWVVQDQPV